MMDRLNARIAIPLLAVVGALSGCGGGDTGNTAAPAPAQTAAATCATPPQLFTSAVWPSMSSTCLVCHRAGAVASGTKLVFSAGASTEANYGVLRTFAAANGDLLMSKSIGLPTHSGGKPFGDANSQQYKDLASLLPKLKESCSSEVIATGQFWNDVKFADNATMLQKASVLFQGRNPSEMEKAAVNGGGDTVLRQTIRGYMDNGASFDNFLTEAGHVQFLVSGVTVFGNDRGLNSADYPPSATAVIDNQNPPAGVRARVDTGIRMEPVNIMKYIVKTDRPWTEIVTGKYTVLNSITAMTLGAEVQGTFMDPTNDNEVLPAVMPNLRSPNGVREHAGVLTTHSFLDRFPNTDTNANRHRVSEASKRFIGLYIPLLASRPLEDGVFRNSVTDNPGCAVCHDIMDPMAGAFQNWAPNNRFRPNGTGAAADILPNFYKSANYMNDAKGNEFYQMGDKWFRDRKTPGYGSTTMPNAYNNPNAAEWLGAQFAADSRFAKGSVGFFYKALFQRDVLQPVVDTTAPDAAARLAAYNAQQEEFNEIAERFKAGGYKVKDLLVDLMLSKQARANGISGTVSAQRASALANIGASNLLSASRLQRKFVGLVGSAHAGFNNPFAGPALSYSEFDGGVSRNTVATHFTSSQVSAIDGAAVQNACRWVAADFAKPVTTRLLFREVAMTDTPANQAGTDKILANIVYMFDHLWNQRVTSTDAEVQRMYKLLVDVYNDRATASPRPLTCQLNAGNDPTGMGRVWAIGLTYMISDQAFLTY
ncbi:MAG TPA: hypothetical protein VJU53_14835 [Burkholderiaceae bacterium]|nr:hypothetical protein [Burkholderiaceae bacterium]